MHEYYTMDEAVERTQSFLGSKLGTAAKKFTPELVQAALLDAAWAWLPLMPEQFHDSETHKHETWSLPGLGILIGGEESVDLPEDVATFDSISYQAPTTGHEIDLYWNHNEFRERLRSLQLNTSVASRVRIFCPVGRTLVYYPGNIAEISMKLVYYRRTPHPDEYDDYFMCKRNAFPFIKTAAAVEGKWGEMREAAGQAVLQDFMALMQQVFGIEDRKRVLKERGSPVE